LVEAHASVGDSAETVALLVGTDERGADRSGLPLHRWLEERILPLRELPAEAQFAAVNSWWRELPWSELFLLNKLLTGAFRPAAGHAQPPADGPLAADRRLVSRPDRRRAIPR
jgi:DNA ligase-1